MERDKKGFFKKGNPGGPGRPRVNVIERSKTNITRTHFNNIVRKYLNLPMQGLSDKLADKDTPALDLMVLAVMRKAILAGDEKKMNWFLEQLFGKITERHEILATNTNTNLNLENLDRSQLTQLLRLVRHANKPE